MKMTKQECFVPNYSWEELLSDICFPFSYLMSVTLQMLVPFSDYKEELEKIKNTHPEIYDKVMDISLNIVNEILLPIVKSKYGSLNPISPSDIQNFMNYCKQEIQLLSPLIKVEQASKLNLKYYQDLVDRLEKQQRLTKESVVFAIKLIEIMMNYMKTITMMIQERKSALERVLQDIDKENFIQMIYGTSMTILCINLILRKELKEQERFSSIVEGGYEYATKLQRFTNELYMLTKSNELTLQPNVQNTTNPNKIAFEKFVREHIHEEEYRNKYVAFVNGEFKKYGNVRNQLVKEMYDEFGNVPMFVEKVSINRREILLDTPE